MKTYKKKLKLKESVKNVLLIMLLISMVILGLVYQAYRVNQLEKNNNNNDYSRVIQVNLTR